MVVVAQGLSPSCHDGKLGILQGHLHIHFWQFRHDSSISEIFLDKGVYGIESFG